MGRRDFFVRVAYFWHTLVVYVYTFQGVFMRWLPMWKTHLEASEAPFA